MSCEVGGAETKDRLDSGSCKQIFYGDLGGSGARGIL